MPTWIALGLIVPPLLMIATVLLPSAKANDRVVPTRAWITWLAGCQLVIAAVMAVRLIAGGVDPEALILVGNQWPLALSIYYDGVASLMLLMVSFVGWVICRYSIRYLDGEHSQGQYFRWTGFTLGCVSALVLSGNLLMFLLCWFGTSLGLHRLLLHYGHRPAAQRAARTKFVISRLGDAAFLAAIVFIFSEFHTVELTTLYSEVVAGEGGLAIQWASWLLVIAAITKSAQFPFHTWLPLTMETPTPVSALMHAGIVNAGGYLIIRTSPLIVTAPQSLAFLAITGALTTCFAAVVMLTQTSIKRSLAYSTIAQMGFMMLQCGLGAFSAAALHILAHSLYKAHAFLSSGGVMEQRAAISGAKPDAVALTWTKLAITFTVITSLLAAAFMLLGVDVYEKPGGILLGSILCLALTHWVGQVIRTGNERMVIQSLAVSGGLCLAYVGCFVAVDAMVAASLPAGMSRPAVWPVAAVAGGGFVGMYLLQTTLTAAARPRWINVLYVHASNGFYIDSGMRRLFGSLPNT